MVEGLTEAGKEEEIKRYRERIIQRLEFRRGMGLSIVLGLLLIIFSFLSPYFFGFNNLMNIGMYASIQGLATVGMTFVILSGQIDISVGAIMTFSAMVGAFLLSSGLSPIIAILGALGVGTAIGVCNGLVVTRGKVNPIITTLGTMAIFRGMSLVISKGHIIHIEPGSFFDFIGAGRFFNLVPFAFVLVVAIYIVALFILDQSRYGWSVYSVGGNPNACFLAGINVKRIILTVFMISGFCASLGGIVYLSMLGSWVPKLGFGTELPIIAATVLGGISLTGGRGKIIGVFIAVFIIEVIGNGLTILGVVSYWQDVAKGFLLIGAVLIDQLKVKRS